MAKFGGTQCPRSEIIIPIIVGVRNIYLSIESGIDRRLAENTVDDLQHALDSTDKKTPARRLVVAIANKHGITQSELAEWFDVEQKTMNNWLTRIEERGLDDAICDELRAGRPGKLSDEQLEKLRDILQDPPTDAGLDAPARTTELLQQFITR